MNYDNLRATVVCVKRHQHKLTHHCREIPSCSHIVHGLVHAVLFSHLLSSVHYNPSSACAITHEGLFTRLQRTDAVDSCKIRRELRGNLGARVARERL